MEQPSAEMRGPGETQIWRGENQLRLQHVAIEAAECRHVEVSTRRHMARQVWSLGAQVMEES